MLKRFLLYIPAKVVLRQFWWKLYFSSVLVDETITILPSELDFILSNFHVTSSVVKLNVISSWVASQCPICQGVSKKAHSRYLRMISDLPIPGKIATINLQVRKFFCENLVCIRKIFSERFKKQLKSYTRRFERLNRHFKHKLFIL